MIEADERRTCSPPQLLHGILKAIKNEGSVNLTIHTNGSTGLETEMRNVSTGELFVPPAVESAAAFRNYIRERCEMEPCDDSGAVLLWIEGERYRLIVHDEREGGDTECGVLKLRVRKGVPSYRLHLEPQLEPYPLA